MLASPHRVAARLVMVLLSQRGWTPSAIADLLGCDPSTVRRWIHRHNQHGTAELHDRPRCGRPRLASPRLGERLLRLLAEPKAWTIPRIYQRLGRPAMSLRTLHRRVRTIQVRPHKDELRAARRRAMTRSFQRSYRRWRPPEPEHATPLDTQTSLRFPPKTPQ